MSEGTANAGGRFRAKGHPAQPRLSRRRLGGVEVPCDAFLSPTCRLPFCSVWPACSCVLLSMCERLLLPQSRHWLHASSLASAMLPQGRRRLGGPALALRRPPRWKGLAMTRGNRRQSRDAEQARPDGPCSRLRRGAAIESAQNGLDALRSLCLPLTLSTHT